MTFLESQTNVSELISQALTGDTLTVTLTSVKRNLNIAYRKLVSAIITTNQDYYLTPAYADLVQSQTNYAQPVTGKKFSRLEISWDGTTYYRATPISRNQVDDTNMTYSQTEPFYAMIGNDFEIFPTPSTDVTNGLRLWYLKNVTDLSADGDVYSLPLGYEHLPALYAGAMAKKQLGMIDEGNDLLAQFNMEIKEMKDELQPRKEDEAEMMVIRDYISDSSF